LLQNHADPQTIDGSWLLVLFVDSQGFNEPVERQRKFLFSDVLCAGRHMTSRELDARVGRKLSGLNLGSSFVSSRFNSRDRCLVCQNSGR
jgi:hypothetical protein